MSGVESLELRSTLDPPSGPQLEAPGRAAPWTPTELFVVFAGALLPRLLGLGRCSLWLDEILGTLQVAGGFSEGLAAVRADRVHPPAWFLLDWACCQLVTAEAWRRVLPATHGALAVAVLADLARRWFGRQVSWIAAVLAAVSAFHVQYSQELRPYSLGLFLFLLAIWTVDHARWSSTPRAWIVPTLALAGCLATLYVAWLVVPLLFVLLFDPEAAKAQRRSGARSLAIATAAALLPLMPWLGVLKAAVAKVHELGATVWTLDTAWRRWEFLTVGGLEGRAGSVASALLALVALAGAVAALRTHSGRVTLAGFLVGGVGVEVGLAAAGHWSNGRYSILAWPSTVLLVALGCNALGAGTALLLKRSAPSLARVGRTSVVLAAALLALAASLRGLATYYQLGRPDWLGVARATAAASPGLPVFATNEWTRISVGYYLAQIEGQPGPTISPRVRTLGSNPLSELRQSPAPCNVLVEAGYPERHDVDALLLESPARVELQRSRARLAVVPTRPPDPAGTEAWLCTPADFESSPWERDSPVRWIGRHIGLRASAASPRLELERADSAQLLFGWSFPESSRDGVGFRWAVGRWAALRAEAPDARRLRAACWPARAPLQVSLYRNRELVGTARLESGRQEIAFDLPPRSGAPGEDLFHFRFETYLGPEANPRPLAAGFDWIALEP